MNLAFIPARGGSKEIPGKNMALMSGRPLIYYSIEAARQAQCVDYTVVSTDDVQIAEYARSEGAHIIDRPASISGDNAQIEQAIAHAMPTLPAAYDRIVLLQPTSPLRRWYDIDRAMLLFEEAKADSVVSVSPINPYVWAYDEDELISVRFATNEPRRNRQDMDPLLDENGSIYISRTQGLLDFNRRLFGRIFTYFMPSELSIQIDKATDLIIARALLKYWKKSLIT